MVTHEIEKRLDVKKVVAFWVAEAEESLRVAEHLDEKEDFSYSLFFGHLAIEKILKAICVSENGEHAPPLHNLVRLAGVAGLSLDEKQKEALVKITSFHIDSRYPDFRRSFRSKCTREFTSEQINEIKSIYRCLKSKLK